jgi:hypothetical protein
MVRKRLTELERKKLLKQYDRKMLSHHHARFRHEMGRGVTLIKRFGTPAEKKSAIARFKKFPKNPDIAFKDNKWYKDYKWFSVHGENKYYRKLLGY